MAPPLEPPNWLRRNAGTFCGLKKFLAAQVLGYVGSISQAQLDSLRDVVGKRDSTIKQLANLAGVRVPP